MCYLSILIVVCSCMLLFLRKNAYTGLLLIGLLGLAAGILRYGLFYNHELGQKTVVEYADMEVVVTGVVQSAVDSYGSRQKFDLRAVSVDVATESDVISMVDSHLLTTYSGPVVVGYGQLLRVEGVIELPEDFDGFSYTEYLRTKGIHGKLKASSAEVVEERAGNAMLIALHHLKQNISAGIEGLLPQPHSSLLSGIVFGGKQSMSEEFDLALQKTGTTHIIAVSGFNVTLLVTTLGIFSGVLGRRKLQIFTILFICFFVLFVGVDNIPVVRAGCMGIVFVIGQLVGRKKSMIVLLPATVALLLLWHPLTFLTLSFQLSFLSTLGLILYSDMIQAKIQFLPKFLHEDVAATFAAILFTLPITLINFNEFAVITPVSNFFVLPVVPFITIGGLVLVMMTFVSMGLSVFAAYILWLPLEYMVSVIDVFNNFDMIGFGPSFSKLIGTLLMAFLLCNALEKSYKSFVSKYA